MEMEAFPGIVPAMESEQVVELLRNTGMEISHENGQRRFGLAEELGRNNNNRTVSNTEVYVSQVPRHICEVELYPIFAKVGRIRLIRTMMDFSGTNRGFCYVRYETEEEANRAVRELNKTEIIPGFRIHVKMSFDNCKLHIKIRNTSLKTSEEILQEMKRYHSSQPHDVLNVNLDQDIPHDGKLSFTVEYSTHRAAAVARKDLVKSTNSIFDRNPEVEWETTQNPQSTQELRTLYVGNLTPQVSEEILRNLLQEKVKDCENAVIRRVRDFAFVEFASNKAAEEAIGVLAGSVLDDQVLHISWSRKRRNPQRSYHHMRYPAWISWDQASYRRNFDSRFPIPSHFGNFMPIPNYANGGVDPIAFQQLMNLSQLSLLH